MAERICDYDPVVKRALRRVVCNDAMFKAYKLKERCHNCPKGRNFGDTRGNPIPPVDEIKGFVSGSSSVG